MLKALKFRRFKKMFKTGKIVNLRHIDILIELLEIDTSSCRFYRSSMPEEEQQDIKRKAVQALVSLGDKRAVPAIINRINVGKEHTAATSKTYILMIEALIKLDITNAVEPLCEIVGGGSLNPYFNMIREVAALALGEFTNEVVVDKLIKELAWEQPEYAGVRNACIEALVKIGKRNIDFLEKHLLKALSKCTHETQLQAIIDIFDRLGIRKWKQIMEAGDDFFDNLKHFNDEQTIGLLIDRLLGTYDIKITDKTAKLLGDLGDTKAIQPLIECLKNDSISFRRGLDALIKLGDPIDLLIQVLGMESKDYPSALSDCAMEMLAERSDPEIISKLIGIIENENADAFHIKQSIALLSLIGGKETLRPLIRIIDRHKGQGVSFSRQLIFYGNEPRWLSLFPTLINPAQVAVEALIYITNGKASKAIESTSRSCSFPRGYRAMSMDAPCNLGPPQEYVQYLKNVKKALYRSVDRFTSQVLLMFQNGTLGETDEDVYLSVLNSIESFVYENGSGLKVKIERHLPPPPYGYEY
jgi:HEAT repeat protein